MRPSRDWPTRWPVLLSRGVGLAARDGAGRLPNRYLSALVERTGKSRAELGHRVRFAARFPTEAELSNAVSTFPSWHQAVSALKAEQDAEDNVVGPPPPAPEGTFGTIVAGRETSGSREPDASDAHGQPSRTAIEVGAALGISGSNYGRAKRLVPRLVRNYLRTSL